MSIEAVGLTGLSSGTVKHLEDMRWKHRRRANNGLASAMEVTALRQGVVMVTVFVKKTTKHELELARQRAKEVR